MLYNFAADSFYIMKLCTRLFVLHCRSRPKYDTSMHFDPHFEEVGGGIEPWWMARWKARAKTRSLQEWVGHFEPKFQGEGLIQRLQCEHCARCKNEVALQQAEIRMVRWMCNVKVKDRVPS